MKAYKTQKPAFLRQNSGIYSNPACPNARKDRVEDIAPFKIAGKDSFIIRFLTRPLYVQLLFTGFAFLFMVVLGYSFTSRIVRANLVRNVQNTLDYVEAKISSDLLESYTTLDDFSQSIRSLILHSTDTAKLRAYITDITSYLVTKNNDTFSHNGPYGYIEKFTDKPFFFSGIGREPTDDFSPADRPWYKAAIEAGGGIAETLPYIDVITGETVLTYSRCIFDDDGNRLGVIAFDVLVGNIGEKVVYNSFTDLGYGILTSQDLTLIGHPNPDFVGKKMSDSTIPLHIFADELIRMGKVVSEVSFKNWYGETSIAFFRTLDNGWKLGILAAKSAYYKSVNTMAVILSVLGTMLAAVLILILIRVDAARNKSDMDSRHKSAFLANMSHEIRTPMNAIISMTAIGKSASDIERKDYCFGKVEDASHHLLGVINDILDMSKIEANKFELAPEEFDFEKMLQQVVNVINFRIDEKHQKLSVHIDRAIPRKLIGDDQRLAQVITNLMGNAVKFTPVEGSITLAARLAEKVNGVCTIQISVSDTGIGISAEQQKKLFHSFHQAESSTTRKYGGTGLGLAISKSIVEMMGGSIWIESEQGKGSTFTFTIQAQRGTEERHGLLSSDINLDNVRVLTVDDDAEVLSYFSDIMQGFGSSCDTAINGKQAIELIEKNGGYHIYFVDWKMPDMDGTQLAREIKARKTDNSIVIMISAAGWDTIAEEAKSAGVDKFLSKPLFPSSIAEVINECLGVDKRQVEKAQSANIAGIFNGRHILLAEDVDINREIVQTLLEPTQMEIDCAENGVEAVRMFTENPNKYDMIFMDIQMPEMDGYEATQRIRAVEAELQSVGEDFLEGKTPIIAMTANVFREDVDRCLAAGMNNHVGKPIDFEEVMNSLHSYLG
jgi:signal transduction histidine kinase/DNA-binding response OmpR family regulator